ncbi:MAG: hypothetical protein PHV59_02910 [Victivallales bacterium]|nr:hypothetical protein [Victivallales bacterium]
MMPEKTNPGMFCLRAFENQFTVIYGYFASRQCPYSFFLAPTVNVLSVSQEKRERVKSVLSQLPRLSYARRSGSAAKNIGVLFLSSVEFDHRAILCKLDVLARSLPAKWNLILLSPEILPFEIESRYLRGNLSGLVLFGFAS